MEREEFRSRRSAWNWAPILGLAGLLVWHGWMTLGLFGRDAPWQRLVDERPVVSGFHPLHQYHGYLGAQALLWTGRCCSYDPFFQAGYPKTPIFDSGSRFAELFMLIAGGEYDPAAYKIGLAVLCGLIPLLLIAAALGAGLDWWTTFLSVLLALMIFWGAPARRLLEMGEIDLLAASALMAAVLGLLLRFDRHPGFFTWLALLLVTALGWFAHPLLFALLIPLLLTYYLNAGVRHRSLLWHVGLWSSQLGALGINGLWLYDWVTHWWIRSPLPPSADLLQHRTLQTFWEAPMWGAAADRALTALVLGSSMVGFILLHGHKPHRTAARILALASVTVLLLALLGISWEEMGRVGTTGLVVPALWFSSLAAAYACVRITRGICSLFGSWSVRWSIPFAVVVLILVFGGDYALVLIHRAFGPEPLDIGLNSQQRELVQVIRQRTNKSARILWEDLPRDGEASRWSALLPLLTHRSFVGGLDPEGRIEHSHAGFVRYMLAGKSLSNWSNAALEEYCRRYNIGWAVIWSEAAQERFLAWNEGAARLCEVRDGKKGCLLKIKRERTNFALHGRAQLIDADTRHLTFANVVPEDGKVVLSFHYQSGLRATPSRVRVERERDDVLDAVPFLRLRVDQPVSRVTLTWDDH